MLILHARFAWLARAVAGLGFLVALAAPSEALASCLDPNDCVCVDVPAMGPDTAFIATLTPTLKLHIDKVVVHPGRTTKLVEGDEISIVLPASAGGAGAKVLGYAVLCDHLDYECSLTPQMNEPFEEINIRSTFGPDGLLACGFNGEVRLLETEATALVLDGNCYERMNARLEEAGVDLSCHDGLCAVSGAPGISGELPSAGALVLGLGGLALALARRRRR